MKLTLRQGQVLLLMSHGMSREAAAKELGISVSAVKQHRRVVFRKLDVTDRAAAVSKAVELGLIGPERAEVIT